MATIIKLRENEWVWIRLNYVWVRVGLEHESVFEWIWEMAEFKMAAIIRVAVSESNMSRSFKMAAIIKLSQNAMKCSFFCARWLGTNHGNVSDFENEWLWVRLNPSLSQSFVQNGRIQDACHHQVRWEWMSLSQIELVWFRVRVKWECFWVNQRDDNKVSESKMAVSQFNMVEFHDGCHHQVESEWMTEVFFVQNGWIQDGRIQDGLIIKLVRMNEFESDWITKSQTEWWYS